MRIQNILGESRHSSVAQPDDDTIPPATKRCFTVNKSMPHGSGTDSPTSVRGRFQAQINDWDREYAYTRDGLTHKSIDMYALANFAKGFYRVPKPDADGLIESAELFIKAMEKIDRKVNLVKNLFLTYRLGMINRVSFLGYEFNDAADLKEPATDAKDLQYLLPLKSVKVEIYKWDTEEGSDTFGEPLLYKVTQNIGKSMTKEYVVHTSRIMPIVPFPYDDEFAGMSAIDHIWDQFIVKKDFEWQKAEMARRHAIPFLEVSYPDDEDAQDAAEEDFANGYEGKDAFIHSAEEGWKFELHEIKSTFPIGEFYQWIVDMMASGLNVPRVMALGTGEGTVSGSDTNVQTFFSNITANQNINVTPWIREHDRKTHSSGTLKQYGYDGEDIPEYDIIWNPPFELTGKELAQQKRLDSIAEREWVRNALFTINDIRKQKGEPPSDHPFADMLLYEGVPLEYYWMTKMPSGFDMTPLADELGLDLGDLKPEPIMPSGDPDDTDEDPESEPADSDTEPDQKPDGDLDNTEVT